MQSEAQRGQPQPSAAQSPVALVEAALFSAGRALETKEIAAATGLEGSQVRKALKELQVVKELDSENLRVRVKIGLLLFQQQRYKEAEEEFRFVLAARPKNHRVRLYLGMTLHEMGEEKKALEELEKIPPEAEDFSDAIRYRAFILDKEGKKKEALKVVKGAIESKPDDLDLKYVLALLYEDMKKYKEAKEILEAILRKAPKKTEVLFRLGVIWDKLRDRDKCLEYMKKVIEIDPQHADALNWVGYTYAERGIRLDEAEELIRRALKIKPKDGYIIDSLGWVYYQRGEFKEALRYLKEAHELVPTDPIITEHLGDCYWKLGNKEEALKLYKRALELKPEKERKREIERKIGDKIRIRGVGTTGSGRELIGKLIGADIIKDEITAHKTGATFVGERLINRTPDTIFEIGGQDSKFISIQEGIVVDFTMNEACAAGTGSFLEEQAERMGINIVGEFAQLALSSKSPIRLGERCTVFMEKEIGPYLQRGATKEDLCAGLAYSIAINYLNRVVRGRKIGDRIFFQGGTAYNDSVAAAFATLLDKEIIVPPYNGVIGAIGAALLAMEKVKAFKTETKFRGFDLSKVKYELREFTCRGCSNFCEIQQFKVENEVTYWGDKCSDRYRKHIKSEREPVIPDIMKARQELLLREYEPDKYDGPRIGLPRAMYFYDRFPFWAKLLDELGLNLVISDPTNRKITKAGVDSAVAEPCFPIKVAHGHVADLLDKGVDFVLIPNVINAETEFPEVNSHLCPWGQTMTYVIGHSPLMEGREEMILRPRIHFRDGMEKVKREIYEGLSRRFKISRRRSDRAVEAAYEAQRRVEEDLLRIGIEAIEKLEEAGELGIILIGRPYNINDSGINLDVPRKLRDYYGVNVIPYDALPLKGIDISDVNDNMYWNYGRRILQAAKFVRDRQNLHLIYITNFKCGPDSYIKHFVFDASGKPYLTLQLDEHANDAGIITRIEAYLDSKGFLRWWAREKVA